ncbi:hypothetical protein [Amycolatopsis eburnea]|uniref:Uncharacterized protein n=1 Tax=Amycolatopsis eburnea TaxID=2267691 RepID=A0A3R9FAY1_9PSEU|nr:hypothetical protein [Amycolatopsis eburnea]RSD20109.1 hypothetical protein EIY87_18030 [Amycolatopsis eburnea]
MCRSTSDGGRRCSGSSRHRTRALGTARKAVERARGRLDQAHTAGDPDAVTAAETRLATAENRLEQTRAAHPHTPAAAPQRGRDTGEDTAMTDDTMPDSADPDAADTAGHGETRGHEGDTTANGGFFVQPGQSYRIGDNVFHNHGSTPIPVAGPESHTDQVNSVSGSTAAGDSVELGPEWTTTAGDVAASRRARGLDAPAPASEQGGGRWVETFGEDPRFVHGGNGRQFTYVADDASGGPGGRDTAQVTHHTLPGGATFTNVNYAAPGAHVGEQHGVVYGDAAGADHRDAGAAPADVSDAVRRAQQAAAHARTKARRQAGERTNTNTTTGDDQVRTQVGFVFGGTIHDTADQ